MPRSAVHRLALLLLLFVTACTGITGRVEAQQQRNAASTERQLRFTITLLTLKQRLDAIQELQASVVQSLQELRTLREELAQQAAAPTFPSPDPQPGDSSAAASSPPPPEEDGCPASVYPLDPKSSFAQADEIVHMSNGHSVRLDDILYGYDHVFEHNHLFSASSWLGVQSQQDPWDLVTIQQILWEVKPKVVYDIGTNVGGSAILFAHVMSQYAQPGEAVIVSVDPKNYSLNWDAQARQLCPRCTPVDAHPLWDRYVRFVRARAVERAALGALDAAVRELGGPVLISVDGWHRYVDVLKQCQVLAPYVTVGSYMIVQDTKLDRLLGKAGPRRAVYDFLRNNTDFQIDKSREGYLYSQHTDGYLKRVK